MSKLFKMQGYATITLDTGVDLSSATVTKIKYLKPRGESGEYEATIIDTTKLTYQFTNNDLDEVGEWKFQSFVVIAGLNAFGEIVAQKIAKTL